jgi:hypothetical protein
MRRDDLDEEKEDGGDDDDERAEDLASSVRRQVMAALPRAIAEVERVVLGGQKFPSDDVRHACVALLRVAPKLFARGKSAPAATDNSWLGYNPRNSPERAAMLLRRIQREEARAARDEIDDSNWQLLDEEDAS